MLVLIQYWFISTEVELAYIPLTYRNPEALLIVYKNTSIQSQKKNLIDDTAYKAFDELYLFKAALLYTLKNSLSQWCEAKKFFSDSRKTRLVSFESSFSVECKSKMLAKLSLSKVTKVNQNLTNCNPTTTNLVFLNCLLAGFRSRPITVPLAFNWSCQPF